MKTFSHFISVFGIIILLIALPITVYLVNQQQELRQRAQDTAVLYLVPRQASVSADHTFLVDVKVKASVPFKGIQAKLTYPIGKISSVIIDTGKSDFDIQNEYWATNGLISLDRDATLPLSDTAYIGTLQINANQPVTIKDITVVQGSARVTKLDETSLQTSLAYDEIETKPQTKQSNSLFSMLMNFINNLIP